MGRIKKRGTSGNAKNFITRTQAIKKLQISLADFRRLCIFKGIYPREPRNKKKANKGSTAPVTFYYTKDIQYLLHEPILNKFRQHKTFAKKLTKYLGKGEISQANRLNNSSLNSNLNLNHIIKERYPTFLDALRDLDDPLNMLFLFSNMPVTDKVSTKIISNCEKLCNQWLAYVAKEHVLKKVFVSIKGVYYQATIKGQEIRWLIPFKFPTNIPTDVDFRIMLTFLEFYSTLLHFVLFKLYNEADLVYPPKIDTKNSKNIGGLNNFILQSKDEISNLPQQPSVETENNEKGKELSTEEYNKAIDADKQEDVDEDVSNVNDELDEFQTNSEKVDTLAQPSKYQSPTSTLFSNFIFFIGREVPLDILQFCILSCDGQVISEIQLDELKLNDPTSFEKLNLDNITHQIIDRPKILNKVPGRTYIQPQWIFDCINKQELINVSSYAPGETLPPHLSPWGDAGSYNPNKDTENEEGEEEVEEDEESEIEIEEGDEDQEEDEEEIMDEDLKAQKELEMEAKGVKYSELDDKPKQKKAKSDNKEEDEEKELKKIMMTNKQKKLYKKMQYGIEKKENRDKELTKKRKQLDKKKKQLKEM